VGVQAFGLHLARGVTPGEVANLRFTMKTTLTWDPPVVPGVSATALVYDTLRSNVARTFRSATCVESDDGPDTTASDTTVPQLPVSGFFYVTRAQDACPQAGPLGSTSYGSPRLGVTCP
jgi:hypothetical protein